MSMQVIGTLRDFRRSRLNILAPHIGHLYTMVLADIFKRWQLLQGKTAYLCTGTDEHGMKIQRAAERAEVPPKEFCDENSAKFQSLAEAASIDHDFFIRTTDEDHKAAVGQFWLQMKHTVPEELGIYKGTHEGWYCVSDECFYPEELVQASIEPQTGKKIMISTEIMRPPVPGRVMSPKPVVVSAVTVK